MTNASKRGLSESLNDVFRRSSSQYVGRMDGDDLCDASRLSKQVLFLDHHREVGVLGTGCYFIDRDGNRIGRSAPPETDVEIRRVMPRCNPLAHPSVVMRREALELSGGYDPRFTYSQDYELWSRMASVTKFANLPEPLVSHRLHLDHVARVSRKRALYSIRARLCWLHRQESSVVDWLGLIRPLPWLILPTFLTTRFQRWVRSRGFRQTANCSPVQGEK